MCRLIAFKDIAEAAVVPLEEVELLLMKAMSLGLVKGRVDEVQLIKGLLLIMSRGLLVLVFN